MSNEKTNKSDNQESRLDNFIDTTDFFEYEPASKINYYVDSETIKALLSGNERVKEQFIKHDKMIAISQLVKEDLIKEALRENNKELYDIYKEVFQIYKTWVVEEYEHYEKSIELEKECREKGINIPERTICEMALCYQEMLNRHGSFVVYVTSKSIEEFLKVKDFHVENWITGLIKYEEK